MKITPLLSDTYLALIKNSVGAQFFQTLFARVHGRKKNILNGGELSCAFFVSAVLLLTKLIKEPHATVTGTEKDMRRCGWKQTQTLKRGSVIVWGKKHGHKHIGFYLGGEKAVSNSTARKVPVLHHFTFGTRNEKPVRRIEAIYWHKNLNGK